jgi:PleD family two-component response regulator
VLLRTTRPLPNITLAISVGVTQAATMTEFDAALRAADMAMY